MSDDNKTQIDQRNKRFIPSDMEMLSGTVFTADTIMTNSIITGDSSGIVVSFQPTSGTQLHFPLVSGNLTVVSGAGIVSSGSGVSIGPLVQTAEVQISSRVLFLSGSNVRASGTSLTVSPSLTTSTLYITDEQGITIPPFNESGIPIHNPIVSGSLILMSGATIQSSGTSLTILPQITTTLTSGTQIHYPVISGGMKFNSGSTLVFDGNLTAETSGREFSFRGANSGNLGIEFGPSTESGGSVFIDLHTTSGDGDFSTRLIRNVGTSGVFQIQNPNSRIEITPRIRIPRGNINLATDNNETLLIEGTITDTPVTSGATNYRSVFGQTFFTANDSLNPFAVVAGGLASYMYVGATDTSLTPSATATVGTINNINSVMEIVNSANDTNEFCNFFGVQAVHSGTPGSTWFTDWTVQGPVSGKPGSLAGITMVVRNHWDPTVIDGNSTTRLLKTSIIDAVSSYNKGGGNERFSGKTVYPLDHGIFIGGRGGNASVDGRSMMTALQIGDRGGPWMTASEYSVIKTGIRVDDCDTHGIELGNPRSGTSVGITSLNSSGWGYFVNFESGGAPLSGGIKLGNRTLVGEFLTFHDAGATTQDLTNLTTSGFTMLRLKPGISGVAGSNFRSMIRMFNNKSNQGEYLEMAAQGLDGYRFTSTANVSGSSRAIHFQNTSANGTILSIMVMNTDGTVNVLNNMSFSGGINWLSAMNSGANLVVGGATALPATPRGYISVKISGVEMYMPYYVSG